MALVIAQSLAIVLLAVLGAWAGHRASRLAGKAWLVGVLVPFAIVLSIALCRRADRLCFVPPFSWLMAGRTEFAALAPATMCLLVTPLPRLRSRRERIAVVIFAAAFVVHSALLPFLAPLFYRGKFEQLQTRLDSQGVCRQTTPWTCGPAASVTALGQLGIIASEGELAIAANTTPFAGTPPDSLADMLAARYAYQGLHVEYRPFASPDDFPKGRSTLAVLNLNLMTDHYVLVLGIKGPGILVADPASGQSIIPREDFIARWRGSGIVLWRESPATMAAPR